MKQAKTEILNFNEIRFSAVKRVTHTKPYTVTLAQAVESIIKSTHAEQVKRIRAAAQAGDSATQSTLKKTLPSFMFSGEFTRRKNDAIIHHSGLMILDFDDVDISKKEAVANDPHTLLAFVSPSGNGLKVVIRVEADADADAHRETFEVAKDYFISEYGIEADPTGKDLARLCFTSFDPDARYKNTAEVLHRPHRTIQTTQDYTSNREGEEFGEREKMRARPYTATKESPLYGLCNNDAIEYVLQATQPRGAGERNLKVFDLARGLYFDCGLAKQKLLKLKPLVKRWHELALDKIRTSDFEESWGDFTHAWQRVYKPLFGSSTTLEDAWQLVEKGTLAPIATEYDSQQVKKLVSLCWHLMNDAGTFYLSMHSAGKLLSIYPQQVQRWFNMLIVDEILEIAIKGTQGKGGRATTYKWIAER